MQPTFSYSYSIPYIILFLIFFLIFLWENKIRNRNGNINVIRYFCMAVFFIYFGFRGYLDTDFVVYYPLFETAPSISDTNGLTHFFSGVNKDYLMKVEPGFKVLLVLVKSISEEYYFLQIISTFINILFLDYFFRKFSPQYTLGFIMYIIFSGLIIEINLLRNSKAIFLFIYSLQYIKDRNPIKYYICNGIGLLFHSSAIFYFPLYFFLHKKIPTVMVWCVFILGNLIYIGQIKYITPVVTALGNLFGGFYSIMAEAYSKSNMYSTGYGITIGYLEKVLTFIVFYFFYNKIGEYLKDNKLLNIFFNSFFICTMVYLFMSEYTVLIDRFATLFVFSYWILYPYLFVVLKKSIKTLFTVIIFLFGILKMAKSNNIVIRQYDNILWGNPTIPKSYYIINKHMDKILNPKQK